MREEYVPSRSRYAPASQASSRGEGPSMADMVGEYTRFNMMLMDRMARMVADALEPARTPERQPREKHRHHHDDECGDPCRRDDCRCRCCIGDADFVIYARLGERRIVPVRLENHRRREREITLELSDWTTHSGKKTAVKAVILPEKQFKLEACSEKEIVVVIDASLETSFDPATGATAADVQRLRLPDVDDCLVLYADLRVEGCDIRPLRFALALLPRDCDPFEIHCRCGCCD